jgi:hemerythrin-like metal-binding protein
MEKIIWSNELILGIPEIDSQHKMIIEQINFLIENLDCSDRGSLNQEIIRNLDKYSEEHFVTEEKYLRDHNYPDLENHLKVHEAFKMNTVQSAIKVMKGHVDVPEKTVQFLKKWWTSHILKTDMEYTNFFLKNKPSKP